MSRALLTAALLAVASPMLAFPAPATATHRNIPATKSRLSDAALRRLTTRPMAIVRSAGLQAGQAAFAGLLAKARRTYGAKSVRVADLLMSFGVALYTEGLDEDSPSLKAAAAEYLKAAVPAYRAAFSPKHPEVALALNSYADVELALHPDNPSIAEPLLEEAAAIRLKTLGPGSLETRLALLGVAEIRGNPVVVKGDPERLRKAVAAYERLIAIAPKDEAGLSAPRVRVSLAQTLARNGQSERAVAELRRARAEMRDWSEGERCSAQSNAVTSVAEDLRQNGKQALADQLTNDPGYLEQLKCTPLIYD